MDTADNPQEVHQGKRPKILSVCRDRERGILYARNAVLESAGYRVTTVLRLNEAVAALNRERFDVVIISYLYNTTEKSTVADKAHQAGAKVLCMYWESWPPQMQADAFIHSLDDPERLLSTVASLV